MNRNIKQILLLTTGILLVIASVSCDLIKGNDEEEPVELPKPQLVWEAPLLGDIESPPPVIEDGSVFIANSRGLARLSMADGSLQWETMFSLEDGRPRVIGKIISDQDHLYIRRANSVSAYLKADGVQVWSTALDDTVRYNELSPGTVLMDQNSSQLFVTTRSELLIFNKQDGREGQRIVPQLPATQVSPQQLLVPMVSFTDDKLAYVLTSFQEQSSGILKGLLYAFDTVSKDTLWDYTLPGTLPDDVLSRTPVLRLSQTADKILALTGSGIFAVNAAKGEPAWTYSFTEQSNINLGKVVWNNESFVIAGLGDGRIVKLSTLDGTKIWETPTLGGLLSEWMAETDGRIYFSTSLLSINTSMRVLDSDSGEMLYAYSGSDFDIASPEGFTAAFNASGEYIINAGVLNVYGFRLPE